MVVLESSQDFGKDIGWKKGGGGGCSLSYTKLCVTSQPRQKVFGISHRLKKVSEGLLPARSLRFTDKILAVKLRSLNVSLSIWNRS